MQQDEANVLLNSLEQEITRLRIEYNKTLAGSEDANREFAEQRVKALIKTLSKTPFKKYTYKFRFENLSARVNVMKINFNRMMKGRDKKLDAIKKKLGLKKVDDEKPKTKAKTKEVGAVVVNGSSTVDKNKNLEKFFNEYKTLSEANNHVVKLNYNQFAKKIEKKVTKMSSEGKNNSLQLRIVQENGEIKIKTKALK